MPSQQTTEASAWPKTTFLSPLLRGLDGRGREELQRFGKLLRLEAGARLCKPQEVSDSLYVVVEGTLEVRALRRGDEHESVLRSVARHGTLGEEALVSGLRRAGEVVCVSSALVAEVPVALLERASERAGDASALARELRYLRREAARDLLRTSQFARYLTDTDLGLLLDAVSYQSYASGQFVYRQGQRPASCLFLQKGLLQIQSEQAGRVRVHGYLSPGDFFGDEELLSDSAHAYSTVALGDSLCVHVAASAFVSVCDRNPGLVRKLRRLNVARDQGQDSAAAQLPGSTQHVLRDAYRMQMARSLLAIDQTSCVRCGHCAWACADVHGGVTRLIRSGDKVLVPDADAAEGGLASLLLPNTCQHCEHPACTIDCPTGAIGRDLEGEVFVREDICTGCGACAKACPWHNIQLGPRAAARGDSGTARAGLSSLVAVKCDLCREYEAPACVAACPTDAVQRLDPSEQFESVRALFRKASPAAAAEQRSREPWPWLVRGLGMLVVVAFALLAVRASRLGSHVLLPSGVLGLIGCLTLGAYAIPKRLPRLWLQRRQRGLRRAASPARAVSRLSPWFKVHQSAGLVTLAAVWLHTGFRVSGGLSGCLLLTFCLCSLSGVLGALVYRTVPARLTRLEWRGSLPEELAGERQPLLDRLYRLTSGSDPLLKRVTERLLLPYSQSLWASLCLLGSGRDLSAERARLERQVHERLQGRGSERLRGLDELVKTVVDLRALPLRRVLTALLRWWQPWHLLTSALLVALLVLHVLVEVAR